MPDKLAIPLWVPPDPRKLRVDFLHYPRTFRPAHYSWDLDRGFRLEVLGSRLFWLALLDAESVEQVSDCRPQGREQDFLLFVQRECQGIWPAFPSSRLSSSTICVVLSESGKAVKPPSDWPAMVLWVRQCMPPGTRWTGNDFFTPEQILHQWGRVARRVRRRARFRNWLPW